MPLRPSPSEPVSPLVAGLVLAAGRSRRMKTSKALLPLGGVPLVARAARALRAGGCADVVVVVGPEGDPDAERVAAAARAAGARVARNPAGAEQIDSLRAGLRALGPEVAAALSTPVDCPGVEPPVVRALIDAFRSTRARIALPVHGGRRGHPALFARAVFPDLLQGSLPEGARSVIRAHAASVVEVAVAEPRVLLDLDTPEQYHRLAEEPG